MLPESFDFFIKQGEVMRMKQRKWCLELKSKQVNKDNGDSVHITDNVKYKPWSHHRRLTRQIARLKKLFHDNEKRRQASYQIYKQIYFPRLIILYFGEEGELFEPDFKNKYIHMMDYLYFRFKWDLQMILDIDFFY